MPTEPLSAEELIRLDQQHIWHPYSSALQPNPVYPVVSAEGVRLKLADGRELIDGMSSWWSALHGYNHPVLNQAAQQQLEDMSHVMFGGLTHPAAVKLCKLLVDITPASLNRVFLSDSGSVSVEVAIKMALQYWQSQGKKQKHRLLALRNGYHGDTFMAMSVCDPVTGMHHIFSETLPKQLFAEQPRCKFGENFEESDLDDIRQLIERHHQELAAVILEPIVQGTGGMHFYAPEYLAGVRALCDQYDLLLICDEIATGFGRTKKLFACEHANIEPDILCLGKTMSGGYISLAATLCNQRVADGICHGEAGVFMHGPTFMANPLACAIATASIELLLSQPWLEVIENIEQQLTQGLAPASELDSVADVRVLGGIGVVEMKKPVPLNTFVPDCVQRGIWLRPFGKLIYTIPPIVIGDEDLRFLSSEMITAIKTSL